MRNEQIHDLFEKIYLKYIDQIYEYVNFKVHDSVAAEDLTQEIFIGVYRSIEKIRDLQSEKAWIYSIASNKVNDYYREVYKNRKNLYCYDIEAINVEVNDIQDFINHDLQKERIKSSLNSMPKEYRIVLLLKYYDGYSVKEIAKILDRSVKSIDGIIQRAKKLFIIKYNEMEVPVNEQSLGRTSWKTNKRNCKR